MAAELSKIVSLLKELYLFHSLQDAQLVYVARLFDIINKEEGENIYRQGDVGDYFYIILEGEVALSQLVNNVETYFGSLVRGDFFGEESLISDLPRNETITTTTSTRLIRLDEKRLVELFAHFPQVKTSLERAIESRQFISKHHFDWLGQNELVYQVRRKHKAYLFISLFGPSLISLIGLIILSVGLAGLSNSTFSEAGMILGGILVACGLLWGVWRWIDWENDYYIVTNRRVVWIEQVMWLYKSRVEAPHTTILSVNITTSLIGRLVGYGDVIVRTFTGQINLRTIGDPYLMAALIEEYWDRARQELQRVEESEIRSEIRRRIFGDDEESDAIPLSPVLSPKPVEFIEPTIWQKYFSNIFMMRFEEGITITFRKHWIILIKKSWKPLLTFIIFFAIISAYDIMYFTDRVSLLSPLYVQLIGFVIFGLIIFPWWFYNYIDWRNDIYQVTDANIFDIERKPLGTEVRKSASLENILSLEHERPGFFGFFFNVGNVIINVGDAQFIFVGIHEPTRAQQDIFDRMFILRQQKEKVEVLRERDRILGLLEVYHNKNEGTAA